MSKMDKAFERFEKNKDKPDNKIASLLKKALLWFVIAFLAISLGRFVFYCAIFERALTPRQLDSAFLLGLVVCANVLWYGKMFVFGGEKK